MKHDLEPLDRLMGNVIEQLNEIIASLKLTQKEQPKPKAPTTIEAVYDMVDPEYYCTTDGKIFKGSYANFNSDKANVPTWDNASQVIAFAQLLTLVKALDSHFGDGKGVDVYSVDRDGNVTKYHKDYPALPVIVFQRIEAAEHARDYFMPLFKQFYGVTE